MSDIQYAGYWQLHVYVNSLICATYYYLICKLNQLVLKIRRGRLCLVKWRKNSILDPFHATTLLSRTSSCLEK